MEGLGSRSERLRNRIMKEEKEVKMMLSVLDTIAGQSSQNALRNHKASLRTVPLKDGKPEFIHQWPFLVT